MAAGRCTPSYPGFCGLAGGIRTRRPPAPKGSTMLWWSIAPIGDAVRRPAVLGDAGPRRLVWLSSWLSPPTWWSGRRQLMSARGASPAICPTPARWLSPGRPRVVIRVVVNPAASSMRPPQSLSSRSPHRQQPHRRPARLAPDRSERHGPTPCPLPFRCLGHAQRAERKGRAGTGHRSLRWSSLRWLLNDLTRTIDPI
jgi:hypothetical protein